MVSADNLPFDVLPLIFAFLSSSSSDLVSVSLVSKSFSSGVLPLIYDSIILRTHLAKRLADICSPFETLLKKPALRPFVRTVAIHSLPLVRKVQSPKLLLQIAQLLPKLPNLTNFAFTVPTPLSPLGTMLPSLVSREGMKEIKIIGEHLNPVQAGLLAQIGHGLVPGAWPSVKKGLESITLKSPSAAIMCVLQTWIERNQSTLKRLTISESNYLSNGLLVSYVTLLSSLIHLDVTNCAEVNHWDVLQMLEKMPTLQSLNIHVLTHSPSPAPTSVHTSLKQLTINLTTSSSPIAQVRSTLLGILSFISASSLESFTISSSIATTLPLAVVTHLNEHHGKTLQKLNLLRVRIEDDALRILCKGSKKLEQLCFEFTGELRTTTSTLVVNLSLLPELHILIDSLGLRPHANHRAQVKLQTYEIKQVFKSLKSLKKIVNAGRVWTIEKDTVGFERAKAGRLDFWTGEVGKICDA